MLKIAIIGGGIQGLSLGYFLEEKIKNHNQVEIHIYEKSHWGGILKTQKKEELLIEESAEGIYTYNDLIFSIGERIGIPRESWLYSSTYLEKYVLREGMLVPFPHNLKTVLWNSLLFIPQKIRLLRALKKSFSFWERMSLYEAFRITFGETFADYFGSALSREKFLEEAEEMELSSSFPQLFSFLKQGFPLKEAYKKWVEEERKLFPSTQKEGYYTPKEGWQDFVEKLKEYLKKKEKISLYSAKIQRVSIKEKEIFLYTKNEKKGPYQKLFFAIYPEEIYLLLKENHKKEAQAFRHFSYTPVNIVVLAFRKKDFSPKGSSLWIPKPEKLPIRGILYPTSLFPEKYPKDITLMKVFFAGEGELFDKEELYHLSINTLKRIFKLKRDPLWYEVLSHSPGYPKFSIGYSEKLQEIQKIEEKWKNVYFTGSFFNGNSIRDIINKSYLLASTLSS